MENLALTLIEWSRAYAYANQNTFLVYFNAVYGK